MKRSVAAIFMIACLASVQPTMGQTGEARGTPVSGYFSEIPTRDIYPEVINIPELDQPFIPQQFPEGQRVGSRDIIGPDDRFRINGTGVPPFSAVVHINFDLDVGSFVCSGTMVGPSAVVTAAHCILNDEFEQLGSNYRVTPGRNINVGPFGTCGANRYIIYQEWVDSYDIDYDFGILFLTCQVGFQTGNPGFGSPSGTGIGESVHVLGYPANAPGDDPTLDGVTMWAGEGSIQAYIDRLYYYNADTSGGQSGGPVWRTNVPCGQVCVAAVHRGEDPVRGWNNGVRLDTNELNIIGTAHNYVWGVAFLPMLAR